MRLAFSSSYHQVVYNAHIVFWAAFGTAEHIPISDKMIGLVPHGNPVVARTKNAIDRAADKGQFLARFGDQSFFDQVIDRFIGYP